MVFVEEGRSRSLINHVRTYIKAVLEFAVDEMILERNPGRGLRLPTRKLAREGNDFLTLEQVRRWGKAARGQERLITPVFFDSGLRPGEMCALGENDSES